MTKKEWLKTQFSTKDKFGNKVTVGDTVILKDHYYAFPVVGIVTGVTKTNKLIIKFTYKYSTYEITAFREGNNVIKFNKGRNYINKN